MSDLTPSFSSDSTSFPSDSVSFSPTFPSALDYSTHGLSSSDISSSLPSSSSNDRRRLAAGNPAQARQAAMTSRLVLVLGDLFIPDRAADIPTKFKKLLTPGKIGQTLCLGNMTDAATYNFLRSLSSSLHLVKGDFDVDAPQLPPSKVIAHGNLRIGMLHGHTIIPPGDPDALLIVARHMDVDVLCWGGTHRFEAWEAEGRFFVNPGSATGAVSTGWGWGGGRFGVGGKDGPPPAKAEAKDGTKETEPEEEEDPVPSFVLMDVQGDVLVLYVYQLRGESVSVEKVSYRKESGDEAAPPGSAGSA